MATTLVPKYDKKPVVVSLDEIRDTVQDMLEMNRGDEDKASDPYDNFYYEGAADLSEWLLKWMTGILPQQQGSNMAKQETMETIEKTIDTATETIDTLERIPKVNLNGTTKKQQVIILGTTAAVSLIAGVLLTNAWHKGKFQLRRRKNKKTIKDFEEKIAN